MIIELTDKEAFAVSRSLKRSTRRTKFGTIGLSDKIYTQLEKQVDAETIAKFKEEWTSLAELPTPPKPKPIPVPTKPKVIKPVPPPAPPKYSDTYFNTDFLHQNK